MTEPLNEIEFTDSGFGVKEYSPQNIEKMYDLIQKVMGAHDDMPSM